MTANRENRFNEYLTAQFGKDGDEHALFAAVMTSDPQLGWLKVKQRTRQAIGKLHSGLPFEEVLRWIWRKAPPADEEAIQAMGDWAAALDWLNANRG